MKKYRYIILLFLTGILLTGCDDFLDVNENPDKGLYSTPEEELPVVIFYAAQTNYDHAEYGMYLSQAWTTGGKSQTSAYAYKSGWEFLSMNRHPQWRRHYYDLGVNINEMLERAEEKKSYNFILIGRTIRLMSTQLTTDAFGDMPLTEAYKSLAPKYDTQESIYEWMLNEADELIRLYDDPAWINAPTNVKITGRMDRIYEGDLAKWKKFTQALKARILLRKLPNWQNTPEVCRTIIAAVDAVDPLTFEEPNYKYDGGPSVKSCPWGPAQPIINGWESRDNQMNKSIASKFLCLDLMGAHRPTRQGKADDPRLERMMNSRPGPDKIDAVDSIRYLECNIGMGISYKESHYPDLYAQQGEMPTNPFTKNDGYVSLMLKEELLLIKAEAQYWAGDKGGAYNTTLEAVNTNMERYGLDRSSSKVTTYLNNPTYMPADGFDLGHLMRQKYICMYLQPEMWTDLRRYNYSSRRNKVTYKGIYVYPTLKRPYNLYEPYWCTEKNPDGSLKEVWIQRINYDTQTEEKYNWKELQRLGAYKSVDWLKKPMVWGVYNESLK